jgi:methylated-DNA-[protein]-cysteine S-methyltransferase
MEIYYSSFKTAAGWIAVLASNKGLVKNTLPQADEQAALSMLGIPGINAVLNREMFIDLEKRFIEYFNGTETTFPDRLDISTATSFQRDVWQATRMIDYGQTESYGWVAAKTGRPGAARAVGQALGKNPLPVIVPCHRVIGCKGDLTGFSSGLDIKRQLLDIEGIFTKPRR